LTDPGNSLKFDDLVGKGVMIYLSFVNNLVEEKNEVLIYDFPNFLAAGISQRHDQFDYLKIIYNVTDIINTFKLKILYNRK